MSAGRWCHWKIPSPPADCYVGNDGDISFCLFVLDSWRTHPSFLQTFLFHLFWVSPGESSPQHNHPTSLSQLICFIWSHFALIFAATFPTFGSLGVYTTTKFAGTCYCFSAHEKHVHSHNFALEWFLWTMHSCVCVNKRKCLKKDFYINFEIFV